MKKDWPKYLLRFVFVFVFVAIGKNVQGQYTNPVIKVLLFKTSKGIVVQSSQGLAIKNVRLNAKEKYKSVITPLDKSKISVNNRGYGKRSIWVTSDHPIRVKEKGTSISRRYNGDIEVIPFSDGLYVINHIPIESYLEGVLNAEISTNWHQEVVKAQSVISRTYALYKREKRLHQNWHISASQSDQVYKGVNIADKQGKSAIHSTYGIVVKYKEELAQTFYHSNCGGMTEDPATIWYGSFPYLIVRSVPYGKKDPRYLWESEFSETEIKKILYQAGIKVSKVKDISISKFTTSGRANQLVINGYSSQKIEAKTFRKLAGYRRIQSLFFEVVRIPGGFYFKGKGNGHGVGLSQWSAKEMAEVGYKYHEILYFFYKNVHLSYYKG